MDTTGSTIRQPTTTRRLWTGFLRATVALSFVGIMTTGIAALHMRAKAEQPPAANPPASVEVQTVKTSDGYTVVEHFTGRLEPVRQTQLAFERRGRVTQIMFEEGEVLDEGVVIARLDTSKLEAERNRLLAQRAELEARQALARATLKRQRVLQKKGWRSDQRYDEARYGFEEISAAIVRLDASIASIDVDLSKSVLTTPYAGTVAGRFIDEGAIVDAGMAVIELLDTNRRQVRIGISVEAAAALRGEHDYTLVANGQTFAGRLTSKRPDLETGTRTVTALFETSGGETVPFGDIVELTLDRKIRTKGMWLPIASLSEGEKGLWSVLTVVRRDGDLQVTREAVELLHVASDQAFVRGTITDGARIVATGTNRIIPGQRVALAAKE